MLRGCLVDCGSHFGEILRWFYICLRFDENSKNRTALGREHQNGGFAGSEMLQFSKKNASEICPNTEAKNFPKIEAIWMPNGAKMEAKWHPKINVFFDGFPKASGNIDLFAGKPRVSRE